MKKYNDIAPPVSEVNEPAIAYQLSGNLFGSLFGGQGHLNLMSDFDVLNSSRNGLPKHSLMALAKKISLTLQEFANIMHISERTLQRYEDDTIIKTEYTEKAIELARLYTRGEEVFGSLDNFKQWMKTPLHVFKGETPVSLLDTSIGFDMIFKELGRIEYGIFALMILYRIVKCNYADLSGTGARLYGGRWNSEGRSMVYLTSSRSLGVLEALAHLSPTNLPKDYCIMTIKAPDNFLEVDIKTLPNNWHDFPEPNSLKQIGNQFLQENKYLLLKVPSAIVEEEFNYLMNPMHPKAAEVKILSIKPFHFDPRLASR